MFFLAKIICKEHKNLLADSECCFLVVTETKVNIFTRNTNVTVKN